MCVQRSIGIGSLHGVFFYGRCSNEKHCQLFIYAAITLYAHACMNKNKNRYKKKT